jgi:type IV pilus assembly protein PilY1
MKVIMKHTTFNHSQATAYSPRAPKIPDPRLTGVALAAKWLITGIIFNGACTLAAAGPIPLAQAPAGTSGREPAPNVIVTVDDSGSMSETADLKAVTPSNPKKIDSLKAALLAQFGDPSNPAIPGRLEDGRIRLAWQSMWGSALTLGATNSMKPFQGAHRTAFANFVKGLNPGNSTPSHKMYDTAYKYMRSPAGINSPWADNPGTAQSTPYMACRRTYHVFMTDGGWNGTQNQSVGNADGVYKMLPDGLHAFDPYPTAIPPLSGQQFNVYKDKFGNASLSTVSDFAFASWATDLQDGTNGTANMPNNVRPLIRRPGVESFGTGSVQLQEFWNPKNNPAIWQHMVNHTIGFGLGAIKWLDVANKPIAPFWDTVNDDTYGGDYAKLVTGTVAWPDPINVLDIDGHPVELWHSAINGRGKFYPAKDANALQAAFSDILDNVILDSSSPVVSLAVNSTRITVGSVGYVAGYKGGEWSGSVKAYTINSAGLDGAPLWDTSTILDTVLTPATRTIVTFDGTNGVPFQWASLPTTAPAAQRTALNGADNRGSERLDYLRGVRSSEGGAATDMRPRATAMGDIVNSNVLYVGRPRSASSLPGYSTFAADNAARTPTIYVGANDGMLHAFDASTGTNQGKETLAYVPQGVYGDMANYTKQTYAHHYMVDGSPMIGDVLVSAGNWRTYLAGFLGAGGKGYFVLNVTNPSQFSENNAAALVVTDTTATTDPDVGQMFAQASKNPAIDYQSVQFNMMNNGRPALILGNGINSTNERPVLIIQYLDGNKELLKIVASATTGQTNGLSNVQVLDLNNDGKADVAYAGDLLGNMWKFDLTSTNPSNWKVAFSGAPLFTALSSTGTPQPITTAPVWIANPYGGLQLGFGTGRNYTIGDRTDATEQTFYSVWDNTRINRTPTSVTFTEVAGNAITTGRSALVEQIMGTTVLTTYGGSSFFNSNAASPVNYTSSTTPAPNNRRGWYMRFTESKERAVLNPSWYSRNYVIIPTTIPATGTESNTESCSPIANGETGYLTVLDLINGSAPKKPIFDTNGGGMTGSELVANKISGVGGDSLRMTDGTTGESRTVSLPGTPPKTDQPPSVGGLNTAWRDR